VRTLIILVVGFVLLAAFIAGAKLHSGGGAAAMRNAVVAFVVFWFIAAAANMAIGVLAAGYTVLEELPIFLLIFGLPAVVAGVLRWKVL